MVAFSILRDSFSSLPLPLEQNAQKRVKHYLVLNWEKCHFMVKKGIVLGHKISKSGIEVDKAKVDVIAKLPHPTSVKGDLPFEIMCDASDYAVKWARVSWVRASALGGWSVRLFWRFGIWSFSGPCGSVEVGRGENLAADHLSRLENPHQGDLEKKEINETFSLETLGMISFNGDSSIPWFTDIANYHAGNFLVKVMSSQQKKIFFKDVSDISKGTKTKPKRTKTSTRLEEREKEKPKAY
ncbi:hypothetical protein Tco_0720677 [Tanacetum coccineum]